MATSMDVDTSADILILGDVNKATGSKTKAPSLEAKACQLNPRPGQGQGRVPPPQAKATAGPGQ